MMRHIFLTRHGEATHNQSGVFGGRVDTDLTNNGRLTVKRIVENIKKEDSGEISKILSSPLNRALESAGIISEILGDIPVEVANDLIEVDFGRLEGLSALEAAKSYPKEMELFAKNDPGKWAFPDGERGSDIMDRAKRVRDLIIAEDGNVVICAHAAINRAILSVLSDQKSGQSNLKYSHDTLYSIVVFDNGEIKINEI